MHMFKISSSKSKQLQRLNEGTAAETAAAEIASILRLRLQLTLKVRLLLEEMYKHRPIRSFCLQRSCMAEVLVAAVLRVLVRSDRKSVV